MFEIPFLNRGVMWALHRGIRLLADRITREVKLRGWPAKETSKIEVE
jgi:hypothetical protein